MEFQTSESNQPFKTLTEQRNFKTVHLVGCPFVKIQPMKSGVSRATSSRAPGSAGLACEQAPSLIGERCELRRDLGRYREPVHRLSRLRRTNCHLLVLLPRITRVWFLLSFLPVAKGFGDRKLKLHLRSHLKAYDGLCLVFIILRLIFIPYVFFPLDQTFAHIEFL